MPNPLKRILVPVDFHVPSRAALGFANDLATKVNASVDVLHVIDLPGTTTAYTAEIYVPVPTEYRQGVKRQVGERLEEWLATTSAPAGVTQHIVEGHPAEQITHFASNNKIDLIVMGTHGRTGVSHLVSGSVTEAVVRTAHCPVVTVRA